MSETNECLICFAHSNTLRSNIEPYACLCKYPVHEKCYNIWKKHGTERMCLICRITENQYYEKLKKKNIYCILCFIICYIILLHFLHSSMPYSNTLL